LQLQVYNGLCLATFKNKMTLT